MKVVHAASFPVQSPRHASPPEDVRSERTPEEQSHLMRIREAPIAEATKHIHALTATAEQRTRLLPVIVATLEDRWTSRWDEHETEPRASHVSSFGPPAQRLVPLLLESGLDHPYAVSEAVVSAGSAAQIVDALPRLMRLIACDLRRDRGAGIDRPSVMRVLERGHILARRLTGDLSQESATVRHGLAGGDTPADPLHLTVTTEPHNQTLATFLMGGLLMRAGDHGPLAMEWVHAAARTGDAPATPLHARRGNLIIPAIAVDSMEIPWWVSKQCHHGRADQIAQDPLIIGALASLAFTGKRVSGEPLSPQDQSISCQVMAQFTHALTRTER